MLISFFHMIVSDSNDHYLYNKKLVLLNKLTFRFVRSCKEKPCRTCLIIPVKVSITGFRFSIIIFPLAPPTLFRSRLLSTVFHSTHKQEHSVDISCKVGVNIYMYFLDDGVKRRNTAKHGKQYSAP